MIKKSLFILSLLLTITALAKDVPSKVVSVIVFQSRAEIHRTATMDLSPGVQELVFTGLSSYLDQNSLRVKGTGSLTILGMSYRKNYLNQSDLPSDMASLKQKIASMKLAIKKMENEKGALAAELQLLQKNQDLKGSNSNLTVAELRSMAEYYRTRTLTISNGQLELDDKLSTSKAELKKLEKQFKDRTRTFNTNSGEVIVTVDVSKSTRMQMELIYVVSNASWKAEYDLRAEDVGAPLELTYKAIITQNTGENWKEVKLTLSTGDPTVSTAKPVMNPQYLDFYEYYPQQKKLAATGAVKRASAPAPEEVVADEPAFLELDVVTETKTLYTNYEIERAYSLNSGGKPLTVTIRDESLEADYEYQSVPKLKDRVFLIAKARNWGTLVLLPGPMNIFFEGGLVGKSYMDPATTEDNIPISLGYDPGINIQRKLVTDLSSKKTLGSNKRETYAYEISVRNNKRKEVEITIEDQVPVTKNTDIKVENLELGGAAHDTVTGKITWKVKLQPGASSKMSFKYEVRYPKNKRISGL